MSRLKTHAMREFHRNETEDDIRVEEIRNIGYTVVDSGFTEEELQLIREKIDGIYAQQVEEIGGEGRLRRMNDAKRRLEAETGARAVSFLHLARLRPSEILPYCQYESPAALLSKAEVICEAFSLFAADESRRQFRSAPALQTAPQLRRAPIKFARRLLPAGATSTLPRDTIFVDCAAFSRSRAETSARFTPSSRTRPTSRA